MAGTYAPMLRYYRQPAWLAVLLPLTAALYLLMTVDSAVRHHRGRGRPGRAARTPLRGRRTGDGRGHLRPGVHSMPQPYARSTVRWGLTPRAGTR